MFTPRQTIADALQSVLANMNTKGLLHDIRVAQIEKPWIDVTKKWPAFQPETTGEKSHVRTKQIPFFGSKTLKDIVGRDPELESVLKSLHPWKPSYRIPPELGLKLPGQEENWHEYVGAPIEGREERLTDFRPGHDVIEEEEIDEDTGKVKKVKKYPFNIEKPGVIGVTSPSGEFEFGPWEGAVPGAVETGKRIWEDKRMRRVEDLKTTVSKLEDRLKEWNTKEFPMLKQNFLWSGVTAIGGDINDIEGNSLMAAINRRTGYVQSQIEDYRQRKENLEDLGIPELQVAEVDNLKKMILATPFGSKWLGILSLLYKGDPKIMSDNPLELPYPPEFERILRAYEATRQPRAPGQPRPKPSAEDLINREIFKGVSADAEQMALLSQFISDIDSYTQFATIRPKGDEMETISPTITSQIDAIEANYQTEESRLKAIKANLVEVLKRIMAVREASQASGGPGNISPEVLEGMEGALLEFLDGVASLYNMDRLVTKDGRINATFATGDNSKLEIWIKAAYLGQAWEHFRKAFMSAPFPPNRERSVEEPEGEVEVAAVKRGLIKLAFMADQMGMVHIADALDVLVKDR